MLPAVNCILIVFCLAVQKKQKKGQTAIELIFLFSFFFSSPFRLFCPRFTRSIYCGRCGCFLSYKLIRGSFLELYRIKNIDEANDCFRLWIIIKTKKEWKKKNDNNKKREERQKKTPTLIHCFQVVLVEAVDKHVDRALNRAKCRLDLHHDTCIRNARIRDRIRIV